MIGRAIFSLYGSYLCITLSVIQSLVFVSLKFASLVLEGGVAYWGVAPTLP
jgi:hypothetical protein